MNTSDPQSVIPQSGNGAGQSRRRFLQTSGLVTLAAMVAGCTTLRSAKTTGQGAAAEEGMIDLGTGDIGILNYALALEGLEAEFYTKVMNRPYAGMTADEKQVLTDIRDHEIVHREFLRRALGRDAIAPLTYDFSSVDFANRESVLKTAMTFEDLGVSAYNGAGKLLADPANLTTAGKIVSVEARHAEVIRELIAPGTEEYSSYGLDPARGPAHILSVANPYFGSKISARQWSEDKEEATNY